MEETRRFQELHRDGFFVMPNAYDVGSALRLEKLGFAAVATTSSGHAATLGKKDREVTFDELCAHVEALAAALTVPLSVDSERLFSSSTDGIVATVDALAAVGAAGISIEDFDPDTGALDPMESAIDRVSAAAEAADRHGLVLTARAEATLHGLGDVDEDIHRLLAYARAGAHVLYAPGPTDLSDITRVLESVDRPINVLRRPASPPLVVLADLGVRRVSVGGRLAHLAYAAMESEAQTLLMGVSPLGDHD